MVIYRRIKVLSFVFAGMLSLPFIGWFLDLLSALELKTFLAEVLVGILQSLSSAGIGQLSDQLFGPLV